MSTRIPSSSAPLFYFNGYSIKASYSFSEYNNSGKAKKSSKIWLDMEFTHPIKEEIVTVRSPKSMMILSQPKEVIDAIAQRDVKDFLSMSI